jgi:hypothetical protein
MNKYGISAFLATAIKTAPGLVVDSLNKRSDLNYLHTLWERATEQQLNQIIGWYGEVIDVWEVHSWNRMPTKKSELMDTYRTACEMYDTVRPP